MTRDELAKEVWNKLEIDNGQAKTAVVAVLEIIKQALIDEESIEIRRFGKFAVRHKNSRIGRIRNLHFALLNSNFSNNAEAALSHIEHIALNSTC